ncbi:MAG TPA: HlyD family efflux transporter periplasmic adaptor subunit [Humisphaera sp.]
MTSAIKVSVFVLVMAALAAGWVVYFHNAAVAEHLPAWGWVQWSVARLGEPKPAEALEDEDPDNTKNEIPVHTARAGVATMHRYVEGVGTVAARPARNKQPAGGATLSPPAAGVVAAVHVEVGKAVKAGQPVVQLDDRVARSAEEQADAALAQAEASLAALKATPRPEQLQIAELTAAKSQSALEFAQHTYDRLRTLAADQGVSGKSVEQAAQDLATARTELAVSQKQLALLKASPTPEDLRQEQSKVAQATAALATARAQRNLTTIVSPIDATVVAVWATVGEAADPARPLVQLLATDRMSVDVAVPADQLPPEAVGLAADVFPVVGAAGGPRGSAEPSPVAGKVAAVGAVVDPKTGAVTVSIDLPADARLRLGLSVRVRVVAEEHKDCVVLPREAVVTDENGDSVISVLDDVRDGHAQATHKTVRTGFEEDGKIEVSADGVVDGTLAVTAGAFGLPAATRVKVAD